ncbi:carcinoembryonic antigen-related cell adhesion molecule 1-like [Pimephales promelas]|uniref:carcinoembryonic antigen-related cell adhesion molecule 1-like n=1 Tax=Pimephales promelas TaxID=90988 RepID=UPI001955E7EF|nr:carcinoembryonic antigen-related cell adhesion molecule 1-like [Pimephales promelas]XP_039538671.1 carcinoembryonic antigen-related cell adhesion molecule 1-like [Pimephales promelas]
MADRLNVLLVLMLLFDHVFFYPYIVGVSVMEGDSVTLNTDAETKQQEDIKWYFNDIRIAEISGDLSDICTDVQCEDGDERFRNRLKLDNQTGSLTITNITNTLSGLYELKLISSSSISEKIFNVTVYGVPATEQDHKSVKEGESVTLDPGVRKPSDVMTWYYNDILIAEISRYQSKICEDEQCKERFRDRLKLDHQTGSLTITHTTKADSGLYKLNIISGLRRINSGVSVKRFGVTVTGLDSGLSSGAVAGIVVAVLLVFAVVVAGVIYYRKQKAGQYEGGTRQNEAGGGEMHRTYV